MKNSENNVNQKCKHNEKLTTCWKWVFLFENWTKKKWFWWVARYADITNAKMPIYHVPINWKKQNLKQKISFIVVFAFLHIKIVFYSIWKILLHFPYTEIYIEEIANILCLNALYSLFLCLHLICFFEKIVISPQRKLM